MISFSPLPPAPSPPTPVHPGERGVRGRLAPSPTGSQHVGNARTYLIAWLSARSQGGTVRLRVEDIDVWRNKPHAVEELQTDLRWLGLDWDGDIEIQSHHLPRHEAMLAELQRQELVYPCTCSRKEIELAASAPHAEHEGPIYPGTCADRCVSDAQKLKNYAWRFRVNQVPAFVDRFAGTVQLTREAIGGDFVVWRSFAVPAYQLAVVADDNALSVTEVIRGDDLLTSTPRQILLYQAMGWPVPSFAHLPLVVGDDGRRLAKRHGDTRLSALRDNGMSAERLLGLLAWSCGWIDAVKSITTKELLPHFKLETIPRKPFILKAGSNIDELCKTL